MSRYYVVRDYGTRMDFGSLTVILPDGETLAFPLTRPVTIIGRAEDSDVLIEHPSISRRHARLVIEPGRVQIDDLGSSNGTAVEGEPLQPDQPHSLNGGELIRLGEVQVLYRSPAAPPESVSPPEPPPLTVPDPEAAPSPKEKILPQPEEPSELIEDEVLLAEPVAIGPRQLPTWAPAAGVVGLLILLVMGYLVVGAILRALFGGPEIRAFNVAPSEIPVGGSATLSWEVNDAELVGIEPGLGIVASTGALVVSPAQDTLYTLIAVSESGTVTRTAQVRILGPLPRILLFRADPALVPKGVAAIVTLSWSVEGAEQVSVTGLPGLLGPAGSVEISAPAQTAVFTLVATNVFGETRQDVEIRVVTVLCAVTGADNLNIRQGPDFAYSTVTVAPRGTALELLERIDPPDWLRVRTPQGQDGWVVAAFLTCQGDPGLLPTADPALLPPAPTAASTALPSATGTLPPIIAASPTGAPRFASGQVTYQTGPPGDVSLYAIGPIGAPIPLLEHKTDLHVLDWTAFNGGTYLLWVLEGTVESVALVGADGVPVRVGIRPAPQWAAVSDGNFSPDGTRFIVEAVSAGQPAYYFFDSGGNLLSAPALPP